MIFTIPLFHSTAVNYNLDLIDEQTDLFIFNTTLPDSISHIKIPVDSILENLLKMISVSLKSNQNVLIVNDNSLTKAEILEIVGKKRSHIEGERFIFITYFLKKMIIKNDFSNVRTDFVSYKKTKIILESYLIK